MSLEVSCGDVGIRAARNSYGFSYNVEIPELTAYFAPSNDSSELPSTIWAVQSLSEDPEYEIDHRRANWYTDWLDGRLTGWEGEPIDEKTASKYEKDYAKAWKELERKIYDFLDEN